MSDQGNDVSSNQPQATVNVVELVEKLSQITRDDGTPKYSDPVKAIDSIPHKDEHIAKIEAENKAMQEQLTALSAKVDEAQRGDELVEKIMSKLQSPTEQSGQPTTASPASEDLGLLVQQHVQALEAEKTQKSNLHTFVEKVSGQAADLNQAVEAAATKNGMTVDAFMGLVRSSPNAAIKLMDMKSDPVTQKIQSTVQTPAHSTPGADYSKPNLTSERSTIEWYRNHAGAEGRPKIDLNKI